MGRASLLGLCLNSLHKADVWAYALGLRSGPVHILFSTHQNLKLLSLSIFLFLNFLFWLLLIFLLSFLEGDLVVKLSLIIVKIFKA